LQRDYESEEAENRRLRSILAQKDLLISTLRQAEDSYPAAHLGTEVSSFAHFAEETLHKLTDAEVLTAKEQPVLDASVRRFSSISSSANQKSKVSQFFDEAHNFCELLVDKVIQFGLPKPEAPPAGALLHDSEIQRLKAENKLYRAEQRLEESREEQQTLSEQLRTEHALLAQLSTKIFAEALSEGPRFVRQEVRRLDSVFDENRRSIADSRSKAVQIEAVLAQFAARHDIRFTGDLVPDLKAAVLHANTELERQSQFVLTVAAALQLPDAQSDAILLELRRVQRARGERDDARQSLAATRHENQKLNQAVESLTNLSAESERQSAQNSVLSEQVAMYKSQLTDAYNDVAQLRQQVATLQTQNESLLGDKTAKELRVQLHAATKKCNDLQKANVQAQTELSDLTSTHADLADKYQTVSERLRGVESESKRKSGTIHSLSDRVKSADEEVAALSAKVDECQAEIGRLKSVELRLSKENETYLSEIQDQSREIEDLGPLRSEVQKMRQSIDELQAAYDNSRQRAKRLKTAAREAESLKRKIAEFEATIGRLNEQVSENIRLKTLNEQLELTVATLTTRSENLQRAAADSGYKSSILQKSLEETQERLKQALARNRDLNEKVGELTEENERLQDSVGSVARENGKLKESLTSLKSVDKENQSLTAQVDKMLRQLAALQTRGTEVEKLNRSLTIQLEAKTSLADELQGADGQNQQLRAEKLKLASKVRELQSVVSSASTQIETKSATLDNMNSQVASLQATISRHKSQITELEAQRRSLSMQREAKSQVVQNYDSQIRLLRDTNQKLTKQQPLARSLELEVSRLHTANQDLQNRLAGITRAHSALQEKKATVIDDLSAELRSIKRVKEQLDQQVRENETEIRELKTTNSQLSSTLSQLQSNSSVMEALRDENQELSVRISELEESTSLARQTNDLATRLKAAQRDNKQLALANAELSERVQLLGESNAELRSLRKQLKESRELASERDNAIRQLKASVAAFQKQVDRLQKNTEVEPIVARIERVLEGFSVDKLRVDFGAAIGDRLQAVLNVIYRIKSLVDDQKAKIERLMALAESQDGSLIKLTRDRYPQ
jgi:chromosome segregation ATPase